MSDQRESHLEEARSLYAALLGAVSGSPDPRIQRAFESVPREAFLPPGPWTLLAGRKRVVTPSDDPAHLYQNVLVALDVEKGINNGEPQLHAMWLGAVSPEPGEVVTHIGAGTGYYTAILAMLVLPEGTVTAFEIDERLARAAKHHLAPFDNVEVRAGNAVDEAIPASDVIYVNAGVVVPPLSWLEALRPGGRLIFPWRPTDRIGIAMLVTRLSVGFAVKSLGPAWFIPCVGASESRPEDIPPDTDTAWRTRSLRLKSQQAPDATATAIYGDLWFSDQAPG
jgi:protein-L-isoaspartate(D-aspartate) O-methyltransferase